MEPEAHLGCIWVGFQIRGGNTTVCIRSFGPSRTIADALADPVLELVQQVSTFHTTKTVLAMNDDYDSDYNNWTSTTTSESRATAKPTSIPTELATLVAKESCIVITLPPVDYSARVFGLGGLTGIGRVGINKVE